MILGAAATAEEIRIVAAADLNYVFRDIAARFEKETGNKVDLIFGSSGNFYSQIQRGAPFDLFFSADIQYPEKLDWSNLEIEPDLIILCVNGETGRILITDNDSGDYTKLISYSEEYILKKKKCIILNF